MINRLSYLRSILVIVPLCMLGTAIFGCIGMALAFFDPTGDRQMRLARVWGSLMCWCCGIQVQTEGLDKISLDRHYIFSPNHLSYTDTPVLLSVLPVNFRFMAKLELFSIPFLGPHLKQAGHIPVPLEDARASIKALTQAGKIINERRISVLIFPEGGRSEDGNLQEFKDGAAYTAIKASVPVVPIALVGTRAVLPMHSIHVRPGPVVVRFGNVIETAGMKLHDRAALTGEIRGQILKMLDEK